MAFCSILKLCLLCLYFVLCCYRHTNGFTTRITCPRSFPCECHSIKVYLELRAVVENRLDCNSKGISLIPSLHHLIGYNISKLDFRNNNITSWSLNRYDLTFGYLTLRNHDLLTSNASGGPELDFSHNPIYVLTGHELVGIIVQEPVTLRLSNCSLSNIPVLDPYLANWTNNLYVDRNNIIVINQTDLKLFSNLFFINLSGNDGILLTDGTFSAQIGSLNVLGLENIGLANFPMNSVAPLEKLRYLMLGENDISSLPDNLLNNLSCDRLTLALNRNNISALNRNVFNWNQSDRAGGYISDMDAERKPCVLHELYLDGNHIKTLEFLDKPCSLTIDNYTAVSVNDNPIHCDCNLMNIISTRVFFVQGYCETPANVKGNSLQWPNYNMLQTQYYTSFPSDALIACANDTNFPTPEVIIGCKNKLWQPYDKLNNRAVSCCGNYYSAIVVTLITCFCTMYGNPN